MNWQPRTWFLLLLGNAIVSIQALAQGIPEPGLIFYGTVKDRGTGHILNSGGVHWHIAGNDNDATASISATIIDVNGKSFYIAHIPMETRQVGGLLFPSSPNTLPLPSSPVAYQRVARVGNSQATIFSESNPSPGDFSISKTDRGAIERLDLQVGWADAPTFEQWLQVWGLPPDTDPRANPHDKGMTYHDQFIAGTDPTDPNSVLKFIEIKPEQNGITITWDGIGWRKYTLERSEDLREGFSTLVEEFVLLSIVPGPLIHSYTDTTATGKGPFFYRILIR
jgi:hypothetical protein